MNEFAMYRIAQDKGQEARREGERIHLIKLAKEAWSRSAAERKPRS